MFSKVSGIHNSMLCNVEQLSVHPAQGLNDSRTLQEQQDKLRQAVLI